MYHVSSKDAVQHLCGVGNAALLPFLPSFLSIPFAVPVVPVVPVRFCLSCLSCCALSCLVLASCLWPDSVGNYVV